MLAKTIAELFADEVGEKYAKEGIGRESVELLLASREIRNRGFDVRAKNLGITSEKRDEIIGEFERFKEENLGKYDFKLKVNKSTFVSNNISDISERLEHEKERKVKARRILMPVALGYIDALRYEPDAAFLAGSLSSSNENPFLYMEKNGKVFYISDMDIRLVYSYLFPGTRENIKEVTDEVETRNRLSINVAVLGTEALPDLERFEKIYEKTGVY